MAVECLSQRTSQKKFCSLFLHKISSKFLLHRQKWEVFWKWRIAWLHGSCQVVLESHLKTSHTHKTFLYIFSDAQTPLSLSKAFAEGDTCINKNPRGDSIWHHIHAYRRKRKLEKSMSCHCRKKGEDHNSIIVPREIQLFYKSEILM